MLKNPNRHLSASHSHVYLWQNGLARHTAAVLVAGCTHLTCALVLGECRDLPREQGALVARNEIPKLNKVAILLLIRSCTPGKSSVPASPPPSSCLVTRTRPVCSSWTNTATYHGGTARPRLGITAKNSKRVQFCLRFGRLPLTNRPCAPRRRRHSDRLLKPYPCARLGTMLRPATRTRRARSKK